MRMLIALTAFLAAITTASAADMPVKAPQYSAPQVTTTWGGFYVGVHGGWTTGTVDAGRTSFDADGFVYGGHVGYQVQKGSLVGGLEAAITNYDQIKFQGTGCDCIVADLLAKVGFTPTQNTLLYLAGGGWWHNTSGFGTLPQFGWSVGGGLDWMPIMNNDHFVVGGRYLYRDLGGTNLSPVQVTGHEFTVRAAYKF